MKDFIPKLIAGSLLGISAGLYGIINLNWNAWWQIVLIILVCSFLGCLVVSYTATLQIIGNTIEFFLLFAKKQAETRKNSGTSGVFTSKNEVVSFLKKTYLIMFMIVTRVLAFFGFLLSVSMVVYLCNISLKYPTAGGVILVLLAAIVFIPFHFFLGLAPILLFNSESEKLAPFIRRSNNVMFDQEKEYIYFEADPNELPYVDRMTVTQLLLFDCKLWMLGCLYGLSFLWKLVQAACAIIAMVGIFLYAFFRMFGEEKLLAVISCIALGIMTGTVSFYWLNLSVGWSYVNAFVVALLLITSFLALPSGKKNVSMLALCKKSWSMVMK